MRRSLRNLLLLAAAVAPAVGCYPYLIEIGVPAELAYLITGGYDYPYKGKVASKIETTVDLDITANVGGASGTYTVTVDDPEGGTFGSFSGTGVVKRGRFVTLKDNESEELFATVDAIMTKVLGQEVTITKAKAKSKCYQEPGGVEAVFSTKITFKGTVDTGPDAGGNLKGGVLTIAGSWTPIS